MTNLRKICESFNIEFDESVSLSDRTTFKVGGRAKVFISPENTVQLSALLKACSEESLPFFILGGGSNLVVSDEGMDRVVISTERLSGIDIGFDSDVLDGDCWLSCKAGTSIKAMTEFCINHSWSGLENFAGLPGSCGGAAFMNARCFNVSFSEKIRAVKYVASDFTEKEYPMNSRDWAYKVSPFQKMIAEGECLCITEVQLLVKKDVSDKIRAESEKHVRLREEKGHFKFPSAGSVFKNNHDFGKPSGQIVDECGLRGLSVGGAQVAPWHGNFIINNGNATAKDIRTLVEKVQETVKKKTGFSLECEIIFADK